MTTVLNPPSPQIAARAFIRLAERLNLGNADQATLLGVANRTLDRIRALRTSMDDNALERLSHLINIWEKAASFFGSTTGGIEWLTNKNADFGERSPLEVMLGGQVADLIEVRRYLETALQGW